MTYYVKIYVTCDDLLSREIRLIREDCSGGLQMRRRGNNNCSSACTLGGRKALLYESTNRENEKKEREREREREREGREGEKKK